MTKEEEEQALNECSIGPSISVPPQPVFSGSIRPSVQSSISIQSSEKERHYKCMQAMAYLAKLRFGDFITSKMDFYEFGVAMYDLGRVDLAYRYWGKAVTLAKMDIKVEICLNIRHYALQDSKTKLFNELNETIYRILSSMRESTFDIEILNETKKMVESPLANSETEPPTPTPYEFEMRMRSLSEFSKLLKSEILVNYAFALETAKTFDEYEQTQALILGTLTSKNKIDLTLALRKLFNFISLLPNQFKFISNLTQIPQLESFVTDLLEFYPQPSVNFKAIEIDDIIHYYDVLQKINDEADFLFFWEIYLKVQLLLAIKLMSKLTAPELEQSILFFEKIGSICQMLYELVKVDVEICIKLTKRETDKRKKLVKKFKDEITKFRKCVIELGVVTMYYLFLAYSKKGSAEIEFDRIKHNGIIYESFVSLADIDDVKYNFAKIELSLGFLNEMLALGSSKDVIPNMITRNDTELKPLIKYNPFFLEKMISHNLCALSKSPIDDPIVPLLFERITTGLLLHGGYNILTVWASMWLMEMSKLRAEMGLLTVDDGEDYYFTDFTSINVQKEPLLVIADKVYRYIMVMSTEDVMNHDEDPRFVLPQVLIDSENFPIVLSEYTSGIWVNKALRINVTNSKGILRSGRDIVEGCNMMSERFLEVLFDTLQIPLLPVLWGLPSTRKTLAGLLWRSSLFSKEAPYDEKPVAVSADFVGHL